MNARAVLVCVAAVAGVNCACAQEINTASRAELEQLNGIGVTMAERVLAERERAAFTSWDDLGRRVKGMRGARLQRLQAQGATVNGERESRPDKRDERQK
jgi:competence protein ComEA